MHPARTPTGQRWPEGSAQAQQQPVSVGVGRPPSELRQTLAEKTALYCTAVVAFGGPVEQASVDVIASVSAVCSLL